MLLAIETPPAQSDPLFWTDFVELRALIHPDRCFSRGDLFGLIKRARETAIGRDAHYESRWRDLAGFAELRKTEFGEAYPFSLSDDGDTLFFNFTGQSEQSAYLSLLLSSLMRHIPEKERGQVGRFFEEVSQIIFRSLMPQGMEVHPTWANAGEGARYKGPLYAKMKSVAQDIRCTANFKPRDFKQNDTGDGGLDLIAWHSMCDDREGLPIAFAQSGCSKEDWKFKHLEASPVKHYRHLPVMHPWATYYFLPLDLRDSDGGWAYQSDIGQAIIVDRLRILRLSNQYNLLDNWPSIPFLNDVQEMSYA